MAQDWHTQAERMVQEQIAARGVRDPRVLEAMRRVPRHLFVPEAYRSSAYEDHPLPIGHGQTISQPFIVAYMTELLDLPPDAKVLEIGTGSGYQAAVLAHLAREVHTIERFPALAEAAQRRLEALGLDNVTVHVGDGSHGLPEHAPFDGILVAAAAPEVPVALLAQLVEGGHLVIPVGARGMQRLERWTRRADGFHREVLDAVAFVPLIGAHGWPEDDTHA
ncbi:MAG: protein-L-isoaspartate(D-aspartate) O-methyltransferase [Chloroflexi bacterium]|nr:protein-L-isoaspartate(D-aspartate) O-methyltransferase [Chloroflexota bacterium]